jgi:alpha-beta hydrolase superfamily lysophospholipase
MGLGYLIPSFSINSGLKIGEITRDVQEQQKYLADPNIHPYVSLNTISDVCVCLLIKSDRVRR